MQVCDPKNDERFSDNPLVTGGPNIGFYAGAPLVAEGGLALGTLCVLDTKPRELTRGQEEALEALSRQVVAQLKVRDTNRELRKRNDELAQFAYRVSHDFKAPLSASKKLSELLLEDLADNNFKEVKTNAIRINQQMKKLEDFVEEMLDLARADIGESPCEVIKVAPMLQEVIVRQDDLIRKNGARVIVDVEPNLTVSSSMIRLFQIFDNFISNGIKYKNPEEQDPFVKVSCRRDVDSAEIVIADNGVGIPADKHEQMGKLFERFHPDLAEGTGVGMAIAYKHVDALGGTLTFSSSEKGTSFTIVLPQPSLRAV